MKISVTFGLVVFFGASLFSSYSQTWAVDPDTNNRAFYKTCTTSYLECARTLVEREVKRVATETEVLTHQGADFTVCNADRNSFEQAYLDWFDQHRSELQALYNEMSEITVSQNTKLSAIKEQSFEVNPLPNQTAKEGVRVTLKEVQDYLLQLNQRLSACPDDELETLMKDEENPKWNHLHIAFSQVQVVLDQFNTAVKASLHQTKFATEVILSKNLEKRKDGNAYSLKLISSVNEKPLFSRNLLEDISSNAFTEAQKWKMMINAGMQIDGYSLDGAVRYFQMQEKLRNPICVDKNFVKFFPQVSGVPFVTYEAAAQNTSSMKYSAWVEKENISSEAYLGNEELTVQTAPQGSSLVGLWHMDQKSWNGTQGEIKDSSGQHNDGVAVNGVTTHDGKFLNEAAGPFRSGQYLSLETKNFPTRSAPRTMMIWFKMNPNSFNTNQVMFSVGGNYGYGNRADLFYHADLRKKYLCVEGMNIFLGFSWKPDSNWHQFVAVYPPEQSLFGKFQLYLDGVLQSTEDNTYGYALQSGAEPATIGGGWSDNAFQGDLDEAAIWSTALTPAEIKSMYQRQRVH